jgi:hypothetical protein
MDRLDLVRQCFQTQHLTGPTLPDSAAVVAQLGAVQAQDIAGATWSVGQRVTGATAATVERALADGTILRTHVLRPTWHVVTPADIRWLQELTAPRVQAINQTMYRALELDPALLARCLSLFERALADGRHRTRTEVAALLQANGIVASGPRLAYIVMHAELSCVLCSGAPRGKQQTYALLAERAPGARSRPRDEALAELTARHFIGHGPATVTDFCRWSSLTVADARAGLAMLGARLERLTVDDQTYWCSADRPPVAPAPPVAHLIPEYDEALYSYRDAPALDLPWTIDPATWQDAFYRPILIDYQRAGTWRRIHSGRSLVLETSLFTTLDAAQQRLLADAAERYGAFWGKPITLAPHRAA